jgi:two-component system response regulator ChvI
MSLNEARNFKVISALVGNDSAFRIPLTDQLARVGFAVRNFAETSAMLAAFNGSLDVDIILIDCRLLNELGLVLAELRDRRFDTPVVVLADVATTRQEARAFELGASDFIFKARGIDVLARRLKRLIRTSLPSSQFEHDARLVCGKLVLCLVVERAYWDGMDVGLTTGQYAIVRHLVENVGHTVSYRSIYDSLHYEGFIAGQGKHGFRANVRTAIARIRGKFCELDGDFDEIRSDSTFGYSWRLR